MSAESKLALVTAILQNTHLSAEEKNAQINEATLGISPSSTSPNGVAKAAGSDLSADEKIQVITSGLQEVLDREIIEDVIKKQGRALTIYWGTAPTGRPHCGYLVGMIQIAQFLRAGCTVKILLADIHAFLDNLKAPIELVKFRSEYYRHVITNLLKAVGVSVDKLEFVLGSSYQLSSAYQMDLLRLCTLVTLHDAQKAGSEVVKQVQNATISGLVYPLMQALDEQYLGVDAQFGGVDQRKIFTLAKDVLPKINYKQRAHLMNPLIPGLTGGKMSSSDPDSKIDVLDDPDVVTKKLKKAYAVPKETEGNGILEFIRYVLLPASALKSGKANFTVERRDGEPLVYENMQQILDDYRADTLNPQNIKPAVGKALNAILAPVQEAFKASAEFQKADKEAYPPPPLTEAELKKAAKKAAKATKDKGTMKPGQQVAEAAVETKSQLHDDAGQLKS